MRRFTRRRLLVTGAGAAAAAGGLAVGLGSRGGEVSRRPPRPAWREVLSDDFTGSALDPAAWSTYSGPGTAGVGWRAPERVSVADGHLRILGGGGVGGGLRSTLDLLHGRWEVRARVDVGAGYGPAILLWPASGDWPVDGEIDVAEIPQGGRRVSHFTVHWGADNRRRSVATEGDFTQWHVFGCEWHPDRIRYLLDGRPRWELRAPRAAIPRKPMHLALQLDPGAEGTWIGPPDAATPPSVGFYVDWVRISERVRPR